MKDKIFQSIINLDKWIENNNYKGYEPFDGLSSKLRPLTLYKKFPQQCLQQFVLRFPFNIRNYLGIEKKYSSKAMGFFAKSYLRMYLIDNEESKYLKKCEKCLDWLIEHICSKYSGFCWGNSFDYQSRSSYIPQNEPTVVWTSLIGHSFLDAFKIFKKDKYKNAALMCGEFILHELPISEAKKGKCVSYLTFMDICVHNSNMLASSLLSRLFSITSDNKYLNIAQKAMEYSVSCQLEDGAWYYGEQENLHWIDHWHTAYNLDSLKYYMDYTGDSSYVAAFKKGVRFYLDNFFMGDGAPKYYWDKLYVVDIQSAGQALDSLVLFSEDYPEAIEIAKKVATWTINNMQDESGFFYYRKYKHITNKTPMLHWGQSTMFSGLTSLYLKLK